MRHIIVLAVVAFLGLSLVEGRAIRDVKSDLIAKGNALIKRADEAVKKLEKDHKTTEAAHIKKEEADIQKLIKELEAATSGSSIAHLEHDLIVAESKLNYELEKLEHPDQHPDHLKPILLRRAKTLEKQAEETIKRLKAEKKDTTLIEKEEALIKKLVQDLDLAKTRPEVAHIERELLAAESKLSIELRKINHTNPHDFLKEILLSRATTLQKQAEEAIKQLKADPKNADKAAVIEKDEALVKKLAKELEEAKPGQSLTHLEHELGVVEQRLAHELRQLHSHTRRDVKADLIAKGNELLKKADAAIKKLQAAHPPNAQEIAKVTNEESEIKKLIHELETVKDPKKIDAIEHDLKIAESRLSYELRKIEHPTPPHTDLKEILINRAKILEKQAENVVKRLKAENKAADAAEIEKEEALVKKLVKDVEAAKTPAELTHLEHELQSAEYKLSYQLRRISDQDFKEELRKKALLRRAKYLETYAETAIKKLKEIKKDSEIATVQQEEATVKKLAKDLESAKSLDEIHKIEKLLTDAEDNLFAELRKVNGWVHDSKLKTELLAKVAVLDKQATEAIKALKAAKNEPQAAVIEKELAAVKTLAKALEVAKTDAEIQKIERDLSSAEAKLVLILHK